MKRLSSIVFLSLLVFSFISCAEDDLTFFQQNEPDHPYELFSMLDDYPALKDFFSDIDRKEFNGRVGDFFGDNMDTLPPIFRQVSQVLSTDDSTTHSLRKIKSIVDRIMNQDNLDKDLISTYPGIPENYYETFSSFVNRIGDSDIEISTNVKALSDKIIRYILATNTESGIEDMMQDIADDLNDTEPENFIDELQDVIQTLCEVTIHSHENLWLDPAGSIVPVLPDDPNFPDGDAYSGYTDTGLGNVVKGVDALLTGISTLTADETSREYFYDIVREAMGIPSSSINGKPLYTVVKEMLFNMERIFTNTNIGEPEENTFDLWSDYNSLISDHSDKYYVNAELGNTMREIFPALVGLFLRADRDDAVIEDENGQALYPFELLAKALYSANIDIDNLNFESSIYKMILEDGEGRTRLLSSDDPEDVDYANKFSMLEQLLFMFATLRDIGFYDRDGSDDTPLDMDRLANHGHGHGKSTGGILTLNDAMYNLGTGSFMGFNAYDLVLDRDAKSQPAGKYLHRSNQDFGTDSFTYTASRPFGDHPFLWDKNFTVLQMMSGAIIGDAGHPDGGKPMVLNPDTGELEEKIPSSVPLEDEDWNSFVAYSPDGKGDPNTSTWMMGLMARICWRGEGPYFSTAGTYEDGDGYNVYLTPGGEIYARGNGDVSGDEDLIYPTEKAHYPQSLNESGEPEEGLWYTDYYLIKSGYTSAVAGTDGQLAHDDATDDTNIVPGSIVIKYDPDGDYTGTDIIEIAYDVTDDENIIFGDIYGPSVSNGDRGIKYTDGRLAFTLANPPPGETGEVYYVTYQYDDGSSIVDATDDLTVTVVDENTYYAPDSDLAYFEGEHEGEETVTITNESLDVSILVNEVLDPSVNDAAGGNITIYHDVNSDSDAGAGITSDDIILGTDTNQNDGTGIIVDSGSPDNTILFGKITYLTRNVEFELANIPEGIIYAIYHPSGDPITDLYQVLSPYGSVSHSLTPPLSDGTTIIIRESTNTNTICENTVDLNNEIGDLTGDSISSGTVNYTTGETSIIIDSGELSVLYDEPELKAEYTHGNWVRTLEPVTGAEDAAGAVAVREKFISVEDRKCDTHEEAIYKNLVWLMNEKKMALVLAMRMEVSGIVIPVFMFAEYNGLLGIATGTKMSSSNPDSKIFADGNGRWGKDGGYGESYVPGDGRMMVLTNTTANAVLPFLYNYFFGNGTLMPGILGANMGPVKRLAFFMDGVEDLDSTLINANTWEHWDKRNGLVPLMMGLIGELHRYSSEGKNPFKPLMEGIIPAITKPLTYYQKDNGIMDVTNDDYIPYPRDCWKPRMAEAEYPRVMGQYNLCLRYLVANTAREVDPGSLKIYHDTDSSGTVDVNDTLIGTDDGTGAITGSGILAGSGTILYSTGKTTFFLKSDNKEAVSDGLLVNYSWFDNVGNSGNVSNERLIAIVERNYLTPTSQLYKKSDGTPIETAETYFVGKASPTLLTVVSESDYKKVDGLLPLLSQTNLITQVLKFMQKIGSGIYDRMEGWDDTKTIDENFEFWGPRRRIFFGLEQFVSSVRTMKTDTMYAWDGDRGIEGIDSALVDSSIYPSWIFHTEADKSDIRKQDMTITGELEGIKTLPDDNPEPEDWEDFNGAMEEVKELFSNNGVTEGNYNILEDVIGLMDILFSEIDISLQEMIALRHTIGAVLTWYDADDDTWKYFSDSGEYFTDIFREDMPFAMEQFGGSYVDMLVLVQAFITEDGFLDYLLDNLSNSYDTAQIREELYTFIFENILFNENLLGYDPVLFDDMALLMNDIAETLEYEGPGAFEEFYYSKHYGSNEEGKLDPYTLLGELFSDYGYSGIKHWVE